MSRVSLNTDSRLLLFSTKRDTHRVRGSQSKQVQWNVKSSLQQQPEALECAKTSFKSASLSWLRLTQFRWLVILATIYHLFLSAGREEKREREIAVSLLNGWINELKWACSRSLLPYLCALLDCSWHNISTQDTLRHTYTLWVDEWTRHWLDSQYNATANRDSRSDIQLSHKWGRATSSLIITNKMDIRSNLPRVELFNKQVGRMWCDCRFANWRTQADCCVCLQNCVTFARWEWTVFKEWSRGEWGRWMLCAESGWAVVVAA